VKAGFDATGDVLVVTGGANGIGAAIARGYAEVGGMAVVLDIVESPDLTRCPRTEQVRVDVSDRDATIAAVNAVVERHGRVDALVAGAAVQPRTPVATMDPEVWRGTVGVNLDGVVWACQAVLPHMIRRRSGAIVVFGSGLAHTGRADAAAYAATKGALVPFAKSLASEVSPHRVRVNTIFPGVIDTPQFRTANPANGEREHWAATTGIGTPADVVGPLLYLLSDAATMTGSILTRDRAFSVDTDSRPDVDNDPQRRQSDGRR
jgi:NAD(P)-dependent dehydrogenase (short-subunit alcohol dehydrogenase family)